MDWSWPCAIAGFLIGMLFSVALMLVVLSLPGKGIPNQPRKPPAPPPKPRRRKRPPSVQ